ncbi:MAG: SDR family oxidoreductase [Burkholderiales bacterium]|nr:SDR family oxidoreductase [Burkholderiales bacterium]
MASPDKTARRVAFVTGASFGIGAASALALARDGFDIAISATCLANLDDTAGKLKQAGCRVAAVELDLCSQQSIEDAFASAAKSLGQVDVLVNNAGVNLRKSALEVTPAEWDAVMRANAGGTFFLTQQFGRHLVGAGRPGCVINIASTHGMLGAAERSTYGISKAAILQMTRMLAIEWAPHGIRVNAVAPGRVNTPSPSRAATTSDPKYMQAMADRVPLRRLATAEDVAGAVSYLASARGEFVTGQTLVIDGGLSVY